MTHHAPLILDIAGTTLSKVDRERLRHPMTGGLILFGRNWQNWSQLGQPPTTHRTVRRHQNRAPRRPDLRRS